MFDFGFVPDSGARTQGHAWIGKSAAFDPMCSTAAMWATRSKSLACNRVAAHAAQGYGKFRAELAQPLGCTACCPEPYVYSSEILYRTFFRTFLRPHNVSHRRKLPRPKSAYGVLAQRL